MAIDTINTTQTIRDSETLVSTGGMFELGFLGLGSENRYIGQRIEVPHTSKSGMLKVIEPGLIVLLKDTNGTIWSSTTSRAVQNPVAQLLDSGNLVVRASGDENTENFVWQSFDYPSDTHLPGGMFELGFLGLGSENRYIGQRIEVPLTSKSGMLKVIEPGLIVLLKDTNGTIWSSTTSRAVQNLVAQLLDSGNFVVRASGDESPENFVWQSFDYPSDTHLPGMSLGWNFVTGIETYLSSWKTSYDPAPGEFTLHLDPTGYPQILLKRGNAVKFRIGPRNGLWFSGAPYTGQDPTYSAMLTMNKNQVNYREDTTDRSLFSRSTVSENGVAQRCTWVERTRTWVIFLNPPADNCDNYKMCGAYGICNIANSPSCRCLERFVPRDAEGWIRADSRDSWSNENMIIKECKEECLKNCSCMAYTQLDIREGRSGCLFFFGDLIDIRDISSGGKHIYIRMASSELDSIREKKS
ncbi:hypothetical protein BUALT_Bualt03G0127900 [Buddleja alternifolia]|uniref:Uncharacterized protein n=1 Tax=Buddleja alternifolia TaxID=168488 RepID=A0AAV6Y032_9LAMI|nr:hypothetical protein BUALT_Bualt03G0127900 [Buddleja alternifolia]